MNLKLEMPLVKVYTNLSKGKVPHQFMPQLIDEFSQIICKDKTQFDWILDSDICMSKVSNLHWTVNEYWIDCSIQPSIIAFPGPKFRGGSLYLDWNSSHECLWFFRKLWNSMSKTVWSCNEAKWIAKRTNSHSNGASGAISNGTWRGNVRLIFLYTVKLQVEACLVY